MTRRIVAIVLLLAVGTSSVEVLLPGEPNATTAPAQAMVESLPDGVSQDGTRADCDCLCACGCTHAQVVVLAHAIVALGPCVTHDDTLPAPSPVVASVDPAPQFRPPRA